MSTAIWFVLGVAGGVSMWAVTKANHPFIQWFLVRAAAFAFMGSGIAGVTGWIGDITYGALTWLTNTANAGGAAAGWGVFVWLVGAVLGTLWVLATFVPYRIFRWDPPDWLVYFGLVIPWLLASVPGPLGDLLRAITNWSGELMTDAVMSMFGMG